MLTLALPIFHPAPSAFTLSLSRPVDPSDNMVQSAPAALVLAGSQSDRFLLFLSHYNALNGAPSLLPHRSFGRILKRLPKASRGEAGQKFATILDAVAVKNDHASWVRLLYFSTRCLGHLDRGGCRRSLAIAVNKQLREEADPPPGLGPSPRRDLFSPDDSLKYLAARVSAKLEEGDFKGAVRLASSDDTLAPMNDATFQALQEKHSPPHPDTSIPSITELQPQHTIIVAAEEVARAIQSFPTGSAGGQDRLRPQHLKDTLSDDASRHVFLPALVSFVQLVLEPQHPFGLSSLAPTSLLCSRNKAGLGPS